MNHSDECVPECTEDMSQLMEQGQWVEPARCWECRQRKGHKMDCSAGRRAGYTPAPGDRIGSCCGHPLTLKGERNTSYYWDCSENCGCLISGCVPDYD